MQDPRTLAANNIHVERLRINRKPPIIFLCGGDFKTNPANSVRGRFFEYLQQTDGELHKSVTIADNFEDWLNDSVYADLTEFETDIGGISSLIPLVLESAGSLVELGLFVKDPVLKNKLILIVSQSHHGSKSFVKFGPIRHLEKIDEKHVLVYDWKISAAGGLDYTVDGAIQETELAEMLTDLREIIRKQDSTEKFDPSNTGHIALLTFEFIRIFIALTKSEITDLLEAGLKKKPSLKQINRIIFLLLRFDLAREIRRGHATFYLLKDPKLKTRVDTPGLVHSTAKIDAIAYYKADTSSVNKKRKPLIDQGAEL